ncbi:MAG: hypothetical protein ACI3X8_05335 [Alloprevotella sp.]
MSPLAVFRWGSFFEEAGAVFWAGVDSPSFPEILENLENLENPEIPENPAHPSSPIPPELSTPLSKTTAHNQEGYRRAKKMRHSVLRFKEFCVTLQDSKLPHSKYRKNQPVHVCNQKD